MARLARLAPLVPTMSAGIAKAQPAQQPSGLIAEPRKGWEGKGSRHERGYGSAWDRLRKRILKRDNYLCQECMRQGTLTPLCVRPRDHAVDHIIPKAHGGTDDERNLESLCDAHHKAKTAKEWMG